MLMRLKASRWSSCSKLLALRSRASACCCRFAPRGATAVRPCGVHRKHEQCRDSGPKPPGNGCSANRLLHTHFRADRLQQAALSMSGWLAFGAGRRVDLRASAPLQRFRALGAASRGCASIRGVSGRQRAHRVASISSGIGRGCHECLQTFLQTSNALRISSFSRAQWLMKRTAISNGLSLQSSELDGFLLGGGSEPISERSPFGAAFFVQRFSYSGAAAEFAGFSRCSSRRRCRSLSIALVQRALRASVSSQGTKGRLAS